MLISWFVIIGPIMLVWIASFLVYKLIQEHIDKRFDELKKIIERQSVNKYRNSGYSINGAANRVRRKSRR